MIMGYVVDVFFRLKYGQKNRNKMNDVNIIIYLAVQAGRPVQVLQEVQEFRVVLVSPGNREFLCLLADLGCLDLEDRGLPWRRLIQGIL